MRPKFEKRHYAIIAATLKIMRPSRLYNNPAEHVASVAAFDLWKAIIHEFVFYFEADNPAFDAYRFMEACYMHKDE